MVSWLLAAAFVFLAPLPLSKAEDVRFYWAAQVARVSGGETRYSVVDREVSGSRPAIARLRQTPQPARKTRTAARDHRGKPADRGSGSGERSGRGFCEPVLDDRSAQVFMTGEAGRDEFASVMRTVSDAGAAAQVYDFVFAGRSAAADEALVAAAQSSPRVYAAAIGSP